MRRGFFIVGLLILSPVAALLALIGWFVLADLLTPFPELARDLPSTVEGAEIRFAERVAARFPAGTEERRLQDALVAQGFTDLPGAEAMAWVEAENKPTFLCNVELVVSWGAVAGYLTEPATGHYRHICL
jgi:hypothetical protein